MEEIFEINVFKTLQTCLNNKYQHLNSFINKIIFICIYIEYLQITFSISLHLYGKLKMVIHVLVILNIEIINSIHLIILRK